MRVGNSHLRALSKRPARAQTVQELKYDTLLVYMESAFLLADTGFIVLATVADLFGDLGPSIPYKNFFGGSGSGGGTGS